MTAARQALAEFLGAALLLSAIVGSGMMAQRLAGGVVLPASAVRASDASLPAQEEPRVA